MGRKATLEPILELTGSKNGGRVRWRLNVPPSLSSTGARQRLWFATREKAEAEIRAMRLRKLYGYARLSPQEAVQATAAFRLLEPTGVDLITAVSEFVEIHKQRNKSATFKELYDLYVSEHKFSKGYSSNLKSTYTRLSRLHDKLVADITADDLRPFLSVLGASSQRANLRHLRALFNFGLQRDFLKENPAERIDFATVRKSETEIFTPEQIMRLLDYALACDLGLVPYVVFGAYCGVRADINGEITKLTWEDVDLHERHVVLRPEITKINRRRTIDLSDNAVEWLREHHARGGAATGPVTYKGPLLRFRRGKAMRAAGISKWIQAGLRHSFCSYFLANGGSIDSLVIQSGHDGNTATMFRHYHRTASRADAKAFWSIFPPALSEVSGSTPGIDNAK